MNSKVRSIVDFLEANLHRQIRMAELTALVGLSHSRVHDLFKAEVDLSPMRYHKDLRLERARVLLKDSAMPIKQIRLEVGYPDQRHFFRDFKKYFGQTPSQYRARQASARSGASETIEKQ
jgi:Transcriptional regulator containing an amidase domain and an AraC-type DNA-binding HTH domain